VKTSSHYFIYRATTASASSSWPSESKNIDVTLFLYFLFCIYLNAISVAEPIKVPPPALN
jgi:hypothetical protein